MALSPELIRFAQGNTDYFVAFQDYYNHYNQAYQGRNLGPFNESVSLDEKAAKIQTAFFAEVERRSGVQRDANEPEAWASNPMVQWAAFAVIDATINSVLPVTINPTIGLYTDIRYAGYGDIVKYKVKPRTLYTITKSAHGERTTFRQKKYDGDVIISPVEHMITVFADMWRVLAGKEDLAEFVRIAVLTVETEMTKDATMAMTTGMAVGTYPAALSYQGAFSSAQLVTMCETVQAYNYGMRPIIAGTATALSKVVPDSTLGYRGIYDADGGRISVTKDFFGYSLMLLPQVATGVNFGLALDPNTLYIISPAIDKLVKGVVTNTMTNSNQFYDNADLTSNFTMRKAWGFEFLSAGWGGLYSITD